MKLCSINAVLLTLSFSALSCQYAVANNDELTLDILSTTQDSTQDLNINYDLSGTGKNQIQCKISTEVTDGKNASGFNPNIFEEITSGETFFIDQTLLHNVCGTEKLCALTINYKNCKGVGVDFYHKYELIGGISGHVTFPLILNKITNAYTYNDNQIATVEFIAKP